MTDEFTPDPGDEFTDPLPYAFDADDEPDVPDDENTVLPDDGTVVPDDRPPEGPDGPGDPALPSDPFDPGVPVIVISGGSSLRSLTRTRADILERCKTLSKATSTFEINQCLAMTGKLYGIAPTGIPSAANGWTRCIRRHKNDTNPPAGAAVWWSKGSSGHGHVGISAGNGTFWGTDLIRSGHLDLAAISKVVQTWPKLVYAGWSEDYCGTFLLPVAGAAPMARLSVDALHDSFDHDDAHPDADPLHPKQVLFLQRALHVSGANGRYGPKTKAAVRAFQTKLGDATDGWLGIKQLKKLAGQAGTFVAVP